MKTLENEDDDLLPGSNNDSISMTELKDGDNHQKSLLNKLAKFLFFLLVTCSITSNVLCLAAKPAKRENINYQNMPTVTKNDLIYTTSRLAFVIPEYKLIFFAFPKVASTEWMQMFMRMNGNPGWCKKNRPKGFNAHDWRDNEILTLEDYDPEIATAMMTSPVWTKASIFREPKERVLSAFLDKAVNTDSYIKFCCNNLPNVKIKTQCIENTKSFESFLYFVTQYSECSNAHWEPQLAKIDSKWLPYIDIIGYQHNLHHDAKKILSGLTSSRHGVGEDSAWDKYGVSGWKGSKWVPKFCENRTHEFFEENASGHNNDSGAKLKIWYTPELERLVEEKWAVEWSTDEVNFPVVKLF